MLNGVWCGSGFTSAQEVRGVVSSDELVILVLQFRCDSRQCQNSTALLATETRHFSTRSSVSQPPAVRQSNSQNQWALLR